MVWKATMETGDARYISEQGLYLCCPDVLGIPDRDYYYLWVFNTHDPRGRMVLSINDAITKAYVGKIDPVNHTSKWMAI